LSRGDRTEVEWRILKVAYDTDAIRDDLKKRGIKSVIPPKLTRKATIRYSKHLYRQRNCIERMLGHLKINRAIATRYDQLAESFLGMLFIASARYWTNVSTPPSTNLNTLDQHVDCTSAGGRGGEKFSSSL